MANWLVSWPNPALCFILAGLAVGDFSQFRFKQKYPKEGIDDAIVPQGPLMEKLLTAKKTSAGIPYPLKFTSPWDPLSSTEIRLAASLVRSYNKTSNWQFKCIGIEEVNKALALPYYLAGTNPPLGRVQRIVRVDIADPIKRLPIRVVVNLSTLRVEQWIDGKPGEKVGFITTEDIHLATEILFADKNVRQRLSALGFNDMTQVYTDTWEAGYVADNPKYSQATKLLQVFLYGRFDTNRFAHPIGFVVYVDLGPNIVLGVENLPIQQDFNRNNRTGDSVPKAGAPLFPEDLPQNTIRKDLKPLTITQKDGPSFSIEGRKISWQNFQFRIGFNPREGPHIYTVTYKDGGKVRPLFYRLSMTEVFQQYGDSRPPYQRRSSFDLGNFGFGFCISELLEKQYCRGNARYFPSDIHNEKAETWTIPNSICITEEDSGILWTHYDWITGQQATTRSQRLSLSHLVSIGNIDYWISWRFYLDATVEFSVKMTGILSTNLLAIDVKAPPYGNLLQPQVYAQNFYQFFAIRIDADIDGVENTVSVEEIVEEDSTNNPYGNGVRLNATVFKTAGESPSDINSLTDRFWRISNPNPSLVQSLSGKPSSWKLIPQGSLNANFYAQGSPLRDRNKWTEHSTWVLPYNPDQIYASGSYLDCGIAKWTRESPNANIENTDVVLWHISRSVRIPDVEDWPPFSSDAGLTGFRLRPSNFFNENPALSVPPASETTAGDGGGGYGTGWSGNYTTNSSVGWNASS